MTAPWHPKSPSNTAEGLIIGMSRAMVEIRYLIRQVAPSTASVIITGPSGSGKELVARSIHLESARAAKDYVPVNCGAIPRELLESELFGHEKGSFTGAVAQKRGRFEEAHEGTLFLDEIGDMPADMQVKLLRVLEERRVQRIGGKGEVPVDARIISATHRDIDEAIEAQRFREDLFYRLAVFPIDLPALSERREDVPVLVRHFVRTNHADITFAQAAMDRLIAHGWPGNVRELRNFVQRAAILFPGQTIGPEQVDIVLHRRARRYGARATMQAEEASPAPAPALVREPLTARPCPAPAVDPQPADPALHDGPVDLRQMLAEIELKYISEALRVSEGVVADAARLLSLQRTTLVEKMRKHGLAKAA